MVARAAHAIASGPALVCTTHTPHEYKPWHYIAYRVTDRYCDLWTNVCRVGVEEYVARRAVPRSKALFAPNGIRLAAFSRDRNRRDELRREHGATGRFVWLSVGSFRDETKDFGNLLRAFALASKERSNVELWIAGAGILLEEKRALAVELGVAERVRFLGLRRDVPDLMTLADAYVMSSWTEAFPIVLLEASAASLPIVATAVGGSPDIVAEGTTGYLVPNRSSDHLSEAMQRLMALPDEVRISMGAAAHTRVAELYSIESVAMFWESVYSKAGAARRGRAVSR
jgi:glycosyltransferase involved in cell wall biosynthesis